MWMNLFLLLCVIIQLYFTISAGIRWWKTKDDGLVWYKENLEAHVKKLNEVVVPEMIADMKKDYVERLDLLSRENAKLIEKNELYRDKLKNLGFSDITLDQ